MGTETPVDYREIEKLYNELTSKEDIQCMRCGIKMNSFFADFKFCPMCHAPRFSSKEVKEIEHQLEKAKPRNDGGSLIILP